MVFAKQFGNPLGLFYDPNSNPKYIGSETMSTGTYTVKLTAASFIRARGHLNIRQLLDTYTRHHACGTALT